MPNNETLEARVQRLEDLAEIQELKYRYCQLADAIVKDPNDANVKSIVGLFAQTIHVDLGLPEPITDKAALANYYKTQLPALLKWVMHIQTNPKITVSGDKAHGEWYLIGVWLFQQQGAVLTTAYSRTIEDYVRTPGGWRIGTMKVVYENPGG